jgi:cytochrome c2
MPRIAVLSVVLGVGLGLHAAESRLLTYDTLPRGTPEAPLLLRTYYPDPDLDEAVFAHHHKSGKSPKYSPDRGTDVEGEYTPIKGVAAAIGVNYGPALSYVFDTTECRMLYAWQGGFVDMFPYWGDKQLGNRVSNAYVPQLVGTLFYKAAGKNPVEVNGRSVDELGTPKFVGYDLVKKEPVFITRFGNQTIRTRIRPFGKELGVQLDLTAEPAATLNYRTEDSHLLVSQQKEANGTLHVTITGQPLGSFAGYPRRMNITEASVVAGDQLAKNYGCATCHSTDGSNGYGPSWAGLFERERPLADGSTVKADEAYLRESILTPNAKIAQSFGPNFMPVYSMLKPLEIDSLVLYIKSLKQPE